MGSKAMARALRSLVNTFIIMLVGGVFIIVVAPFARIVMIQRVMRESAEHMRQDRYSQALDELMRYEAWAVNYPCVSLALYSEMVRCNFRAGDTPAAEACAELMRDEPRKNTTPGMISLLLERGPNWLANKLVSYSHSTKYGWDPGAGYSVILGELELAQQYDILEQVARKVLARMPGHRAASDVLLRAEQGTLRTSRTGTPGAPLTPGVSRPAGTPVPTAADPARSLPKFPGDRQQPTAEEFWDDEDDLHGESVERLTARETELVRLIEARRKELGPAAGESPADRKYRETATRYNGFADNAKELEGKMNKATGAERMQIMDQLRGLKGEESRLRAELQQAKKERDAWRKTHDAEDPELSKLEDELRFVRRQIKGQ